MQAFIYQRLKIKTNMKYGFISTELDLQSTEILQKIRLSMNGITSSQMTKRGIDYKKNYGVAIPRIKEIAFSITPNHHLAQHLWKLSIRETMILATMLQPIDDFKLEIAQNWISKFDQIEIIEQCCMNLFSKLPYAKSLSIDCLRTENEWQNITGFILAARIYKQLNNLEIEIIIQKALQLLEIGHYQLNKSIALCLSRLCRQNKETASLVWNHIKEFNIEKSNHKAFIYSEVEQELLFLEIL
jgi:3-methyladenine DNA glycosylase AlkD